MDFGYILKGKYWDKEWKSEIYYDAENFDKAFYDFSRCGISDLKRYTVYICYEEIRNDET